MKKNIKYNPEKSEVQRIKEVSIQDIYFKIILIYPICMFLFSKLSQDFSSEYQLNTYT
jgi:hypothetical protein